MWSPKRREDQKQSIVSPSKPSEGSRQFSRLPRRKFYIENVSEALQYRGGGFRGHKMHDWNSRVF